jgi:hypothetical protein
MICWVSMVISKMSGSSGVELSAPPSSPGLEEFFGDPPLPITPLILTGTP